MDVNAGVIADGEATVQDVGKETFRQFLETASGSPSKSESQGIGESD